MKILCRVAGQDAMIVSYVQGRRGKVRAIVITGGEIRAVALKDIELGELPPELRAPEGRVVPMKAKKHARTV